MAALSKTGLDMATLGPESGEKERVADVSSALVDLFRQLNVCGAFGLTGGALARLFDAFGRATFPVVHCRHETGAAFAATEASLATDRPAVVFATTGPGVMNTLTGLAAARAEGAHVILVSAVTAPAARGRGACQETGPNALMSGLYEEGPLFHYAQLLEHPAQFGAMAARLSVGLQRPGGFVAHIGIPTPLQAATLPHRPLVRVGLAGTGVSPAAVAEARAHLESGPFVIWAGFGARNAGRELLDLAEATGAPVMCSPRAKGIFPESHPLYLGVTGLGGHETVESYFAHHRPTTVLVLGTRLGEPTSYWQQSLLPTGTLVHVDCDSSAFGAAYSTVPTLGVQAEIKAFLSALNAQLATRPVPRPHPLGPGRPVVPVPSESSVVRAAVLMAAVQRRVVEGCDAPVFTESGNAFAWGNSLLRFDEPRRYRVSVGFGSMGHAAAGVVGAALVRRGKAVAVVGDGSMLMFNELSTAVALRAQAVWIIMNDACYGMVKQGMLALGFYPPDVNIPATDFAALARAMGGDGVTVRSELEVEDALCRAMEATKPFVVDVHTDPTEAAPWLKRIQALILQGAEAKRGRT